MYKKLNLPYTLILLLFFTLLQACKPDCEKGEILTQDYKIYQSWYPYKELDTLHFFRPVENDTLVFYGEIYKYPFYKRIGGCDCCDDENNEYLQQSFKDNSGKYKFNVEMDGRNIKFNMFDTISYNYDFGGNVQLYEEVTTPDFFYKEANRLNYGPHSCYYVPRIGLVKYKFDDLNTWLFLRY